MSAPRIFTLLVLVIFPLLLLLLGVARGQVRPKIVHPEVKDALILNKTSSLVIFSSSTTATVVVDYTGVFSTYMVFLSDSKSVNTCKFQGAGGKVLKFGKEKQAVIEPLGWTFLCLFDGRVRTNVTTIHSHSVLCDHPSWTQIPSLTNKSLTVEINGVALNTVAKYEGRPSLSSIFSRVSSLSHSLLLNSNSKDNYNHKNNIMHPSSAKKASARPEGAGLSLTQTSSHDHEEGIAENELARQKNAKYRFCGCLPMWYRTENLEEWLHYHFRIGMEYMVIYDNDSELDHLREMSNFLKTYFNIHYIFWPWEGTQTSMLRHCNIFLRNQCEWIHHIDIDEFIVLGPNINSLGEAYDRIPTNVSGVQFKLATFYPSGRDDAVPKEGQIMAYDCRDSNYFYLPKCSIKPLKLHPTWWHTVHYFCFKNGDLGYTVPENIMTLNHYKYPAWDVYYKKFLRRTNINAQEFHGHEFNKDVEKRVYLKTLHKKCQLADHKLQAFFLDKFTYKALDLFSGSRSNISPNQPWPLNASTLKHHPKPARRILITGVDGESFRYFKRAVDDVFSSQTSEMQVTVVMNWKLAIKPGSPQASFEDIPNGLLDRLRFDKVIHFVEHPLLAIPSIIKTHGPTEWQYIQDSISLNTMEAGVGDSDAARRPLYHWIMWNLQADKISDMIVHFHSQDFLIAEIKKLCSFSETESFDQMQCQTQIEALLSKPHSPLCSQQSSSWEELISIDPFASTLAQNMTLAYGMKSDLRINC